MDTESYPLEGLRVLDLSRVLAGPVCTQILADLGANVVKVERPGVGDDTRQWGPPFLEGGGASGYFLSCNRAKRSIALDLSHEAGREVVEALVQRADVLVENFRFDSLARLGLSPDRLARLNPDLVSCSISAFGRTGPRAKVPGYDLMIQAAAGVMSITGEPDGVPMKVGVAISDVVTGLYAAVSVLAGLVARGKGQAARAFDLALFDCTLASLVNVAQNTLLSEEPCRRWGNAHPHIVPYEGFATADGYLVLAIGADRQWRRFCQAVAHDDWAIDPRFATNPQRVAYREELIPLLQKLLSTRTSAQWQQLLESLEIPHSQVASLDKIVRQPQVAARQMVLDTTDASGRNYRLLASPIHWQGEPPRRVKAPPDLGQHTDEVLKEWLDYTPEQIAGLRQQGVVA